MFVSFFLKKLTFNIKMKFLTKLFFDLFYNNMIKINNLQKYFNKFSKINHDIIKVKFVLFLNFLEEDDENSIIVKNF